MTDQKNKELNDTKLYVDDYVGIVWGAALILSAGITAAAGNHGWAIVFICLLWVLIKMCGHIEKERKK